MKGLIEGRIVHYVLDGGPNKGQHRPAIIVKVWNQNSGVCNLQAFYDGKNDYRREKASSFPELEIRISLQSWLTSIPYDPGGAENTWHWIEGSHT